MIRATLVKENIKLGLAYSLEVKSIIIVMTVCMPADMVLEELRALHLEGDCAIGPSLSM